MQSFRKYFSSIEIYEITSPFSEEKLEVFKPIQPSSLDINELTSLQRYKLFTSLYNEKLFNPANVATTKLALIQLVDLVKQELNDQNKLKEIKSLSVELGDTEIKFNCRKKIGENHCIFVKKNTVSIVYIAHNIVHFIKLTTGGIIINWSKNPGETPESVLTKFHDFKIDILSIFLKAATKVWGSKLDNLLPEFKTNIPLTAVTLPQSSYAAMQNALNQAPIQQRSKRRDIKPYEEDITPNEQIKPKLTKIKKQKTINLADIPDNTEVGPKYPHLEVVVAPDIVDDDVAIGPSVEMPADAQIIGLGIEPPEHAEIGPASESSIRCHFNRGMG